MTEERDLVAKTAFVHEDRSKHPWLRRSVRAGEVIRRSDPLWSELLHVPDLAEPREAQVTDREWHDFLAEPDWLI